MKITELLNEEKISKSEQAWSWLIADTILGPAHPEDIKRYEEYKKSKVDAKKYYRDNSDFFHRCVGDLFLRINTENGVLSNLPSAFGIYNYDILGSPTFTINKCDTFEIIDAYKMTKLENFLPKKSTSIMFNNVGIKSYHDIDKIIPETEHIYITNKNNVPIPTHLLGLLKIKNLFSVKLPSAELTKIIDRYLPNTEGNKGIFRCQNELIEAGFIEQAQL